MFDRIILAVLAATLTLTACPALSADGPKVSTTYRLTDFRGDAAWRITSLNSNVGASAFQDGVLTCDFSGNPGYIGIGPSLEPLLGTPSAVTLTFESNTSGHPLVLRFQDADGQFFQRQIAILDTDGVKDVTVPLSDMSTWFHFGGKDDGVVRPPVKVVEIIVDTNGPDTSVKFVELTATSEIPIDQAVTLSVTGRKRTGLNEVLSLTCRSLLPVPVSAFMSWSVTDIFGKVLDTGGSTVAMIPGVDIVVPVKVRVGDVRLCDVKLVLDVDVNALGSEAPRPLKPRQSGLPLGNETRRITRTVSTSVVGPVRSGGRTTGLIADSPFGMGIYLGQRYPVDQMDKVARMGRDIGVKWMRDEFNWGRMEPERGEWNWEPYDRSVDAATRNGISIFGLLCYWAPWTKPYTEEGIRDYCDYVKAVVGRYKDRIKYWEIWNEPNIFFWQGTVEQYAQLLAAAYDAVKEADPDAKVIGCCTAGTDLKFIENVFKLGGYDNMDILSIHPYRYPATPEETDFIGELEKADALVRKYGKPKEIWITEIGWPTNVGGNGSSEAKQAAMIVRTYIQAIVSGVVQKTFWYNYRNDGMDPNYNEHNFGIIRPDLSAKPAYTSFGVMTRALEGKRFVRSLDTPDGVCAYLFEGSAGRTIAAWAVSGTSILTIMSRTPVSVMDIVGATTQRRPVDGKVVITVSQSPVFISGVPQDVKVSATAPIVADAGLSEPLSVTVIPTGPASFSVRAIPNLALQEPAAVRVGIPGYADRFDVPVDARAHTEVYNLPQDVSIAGKLLPVTITTEIGNRQSTRVSNVVYQQCPRAASADDVTAGAPLVPDKPDMLDSAVWGGADDLSAQVWTAWDDAFFHLTAEVNDNVFSCDHTLDEIWKGDSVQFSIDPDHTEDAGLGRVYEFGLARTPDGPQVYCWYAPPGEKTGLVTSARLTVDRAGSVTTYKASIPLTAMKRLKPAPGKVVGFSVIVNDNDGSGRRGWIEWAPGLGRHKSPSMFGDLVFTD